MAHWGVRAMAQTARVALGSAYFCANPWSRTRHFASIRWEQPTEDCRMIEIETILMPISFGSGHAERYLGLAQVLTDVSPLVGRSISFVRLVASSLVREDDDVSTVELPPPPAPPAGKSWRKHPRAPHLRLVVSRDGEADATPDPLHLDPQESLRKIFEMCAASAARTAH